MCAQVTKSYDMPEPQKLEYIREIGFTHLRISEGLNTQLQLLGCIARMANLVHNGSFAPVAAVAPSQKMGSSGSSGSASAMVE